MTDFTKQREIVPECEDRDYWRKRFNFAAWLFLFFGLFAIFTDSLNSAIIAITVSLGFRIFDTLNELRHLKWHMRNHQDRH